MKHLLLFSIVLLLSVAAFAVEPTSAKPMIGTDIRELKWDDLVPPDYRPDLIFEKFRKRADKLSDDDPRAEQLQQELMAAWASAPVVKALNGKTIKMAGYVVPFEGDGKKVNEFLLVPSFGMCIHVPPPPSNQVVYVIAPRGSKAREMFEIVWVTGVLHTEGRANSLASAGYTLTAKKIEDY